MLLVFKMLLVAIGIFGQGRIMPNPESAVESELDTLALPDDHPEWILARRAMASEGLCHPDRESGKDTSSVALTGDLQEGSVYDHSIVRLVAEACE
jgi:hypothetical protein